MDCEYGPSTNKSDNVTWCFKISIHHRFQQARMVSVAAMIFVLLSPLACCVNAAQDQSLFLVRTRIADGTVCGLSGFALSLPDELQASPRAWVGILEVEDGGPSVPAIRDRNRNILQKIINRDSDLTPVAEIEARRRQCQDISPRFFDVVIVQHPVLPHAHQSSPTYSWMVDWDLDQHFSDESRWAINDCLPAQKGHMSDILQVRLTANHRPAVVHVFQPSALTPTVPTGTTPVEDHAVPLHSNSKRVTFMPEDVLNIRSKLVELDHPAVRKQHLPKIIQATDELLRLLNSKEHAFTKAQLRQADDWITDALYRRGRALGYMELPDVIARHPIQDQRWLNEEFEATFQKLKQRVDVTAPNYILLYIRRERRLGNRGLALDLVNHYQKTHPDPVWHFKKRLDLMKELGANDHAHQSACDLWLHASKPDRPICCVIRVNAKEVPDASAVDGDWLPRAPWRSAAPSFHQVGFRQWETVLWLDKPNAELSSSILEARYQGSEAKCPIAEVLRFHVSSQK